MPKQWRFAIHAVTLRARSEGARVVVAGRDKDKLAGAYDDPGVNREVVAITDDVSRPLAECSPRWAGKRNF